MAISSGAPASHAGQRSLDIKPLMFSFCSFCSANGNKGASVNQGVRWIALTCSALSLMLEFSAGAVARECREIQAGWWQNQPFLGTKFSKQHFNECTRKYRKENWKVFDVSGPNCQPSGSKQRSARPETAIDECGGDGGDPGGRFFCVTKATACSPRN
jgi:hypothetical protein